MTRRNSPIGNLLGDLHTEDEEDIFANHYQMKHFMDIESQGDVLPMKGLSLDNLDIFMPKFT
jgi:hypothetical protein